jgi:hypothetical protein
MQLQSDHALLPLSPRSPQHLTHARGLLLRARRSTVWVTVDGDTRDILLEPGQRWVVDSDRPVLVSALGGSALVELCDANLQRDRARRITWSERLQSLWRRAGRNTSISASGAAA